LFVVIIGPDGSGKSTLVKRALDELAGEFRATWRFHWRPGLLPKAGTPRAGGSPQSGPPPKDYEYGSLVSFVRYLYYLIDFVVGYWTVIYPKKARKTLVLGERWYYDVIVNPQRYGFRLPPWLLRLGGWLVPKPDLTVLLEAPVEEIHARKPELSVGELHLQLQMMRAVLPNSGCRISTTGSIDRSTGELVRAILDVTQRRTVSSARGTAIGCRDEWRAFPKTGNSKLWIHSRDPIANALHLYHPYSWIGRTVIHIVAYLPRRLTTRRLEVEYERRLVRLADAIRHMLGHEDLVISFSTGTPTAHRKITAQVSRQGTIVAYVKIGSTDVAKKLIEAEALALSRLDPPALATGVSVPRVLARSTLDDSSLLALSAPLSPGRQRSTMLDEHDIRMLESLIPDRPRIKPLDQVLGIIGFRETDTVVRGVNPELIKHVREAIESLLGHGVRVGPAHGDYVPWNSLMLNDGSLYVFDWEHANEAPLLSDFFHRVFMPDRLVNGGFPPRVAMSRLLATMNLPLARPMLEKCGITSAEFPAYLLLYFLQLAMRETHEKGGIDGYLQECIHLALIFARHPAHRWKVLVSAYACEPGEGSEPGVGWHWMQQISQHSDLWVITRANNRQAIETELAKNPMPQVHFEYVDLPRWLTFWKRKQRGVRTYYYLWQYAALARYRKLRHTVRFDLGHHVTFVNDWLWSFLVFTRLPYVWGPIGSHPSLPLRFIPRSAARATELIRRGIQSVMRILDPQFWLTALRAQAVLGINTDVAKHFPLNILARDSFMVEPAIGIDGEQHAHGARSAVENRILFVGRFASVKAPFLAVESFARLAVIHPDITLTLIGRGPEKQDLLRRIARHGLGDRIKIMDWLPRETVRNFMRSATLFLFPSFEGGGMVVLEAMEVGLPVVCLDYGGPGTMVTPASGRKIPVRAVGQVVSDLSVAMAEIISDPALRHDLSRGAQQRAMEHFDWKIKSELTSKLYAQTMGFPGPHIQKK
jgi:glycosyltransferase involved in cell wall biosynthesis/thymidylate kinase